MKAQDLFNYSWTRVRSSDPHTSHEAAESLSEDDLNRQHRAILSVLADGVPRAAEQIEDVLGFPIWRRMNELERRGFITPNGELHINRSGRRARRYVRTR